LKNGKKQKTLTSKDNQGFFSNFVIQNDLVH